ncbi:MAG: hypothetical protein H0T48_16790 [Gemmatimonadaceae bacterium]|nr:hypothetical protein [Gemmatimonadaceae bacterium]
MTGITNPARAPGDSSALDGGAQHALTREQKLELYYYMRFTRSLEDYVLPQTADIVKAVRRLAAY